MFLTARETTAALGNIARNRNRSGTHLLTQAVNLRLREGPYGNEDSVNEVHGNLPRNKIAECAHKVLGGRLKASGSEPVSVGFKSYLGKKQKT